MSKQLCTAAILEFRFGQYPRCRCPVKLSTSNQPCFIDMFLVLAVGLRSVSCIIIIVFCYSPVELTNVSFIRGAK